jgi:UDP-N-acetyl-2-amino-2-deoxyglucuronate dehydrogenase
VKQAMGREYGLVKGAGMSYRAGIIGCGSIAAAHARAYQAVPGIELAAAADPVERARRAFQEKFAIPRIYAEAGEMLQGEKLDFVSICLWHPLHAEFTLRAAEHRPRAILCEKPMATCVAEADAMIAACEASGVKLAIGHQRRFNRSWTRARELLAEGAIGTPVMITVQTGEGLLNCGTHVVDAIRYMLGDAETEWVFGAVERQTDRFERNVRSEDCCMGLIQFRNGAQALVQCDLTGTSQVENYSIRGSEGVLDVRQRELRLLRGSGWEVIETGYEDPWVGQARELVAWVEGRSGHRNEAGNGRATLEILMAIYQSAREHAVVRMPLMVGENPLDRMVEEGKLAVKDGGAYDIRLFLSFEPGERERYDQMRRQGMHPREILRALGRG